MQPCFLYPNERPCMSQGTPEPTHYIVLATLCVIIATLIFILDGIFLITVLTNKKLRTKSNVLLVFMAVADFLKGIFPLPLGTYVFVNLYRCTVPCIAERVMGISGVLLVHSTTVVIVFIATDILLSIKWPFFYRSKVTQKALIVSLTAVWLCLWVIIVIIGANLHKYDDFTWIFVVFLCISVLVTSIVVVTYLSVQKEIGRMYRRSVSQYSQEDISARRAQRKMMITMCLVLATYLLCYLPYIITWNYVRVYHHHKYSYLLIHYTEVIGMCKPLVNVFIYYFRLRTIRRCCSKMLRRMFCVLNVRLGVQRLNVNNRTHPEPSSSTETASRRRVASSHSVGRTQETIRKRTWSRRRKVEPPTQTLYIQ